MGAGDHEHPAEGQVLADHETELDDLGVAEMRAQLVEEGGIDRVEVGREPLRITNRQRVARRELAFGLGPVDLRDRRFVESLTRSLRVPGEESSIAGVDRRDLEARELFDARRGDALGMGGAEEREIAFEEFRRELEHVHGGHLDPEPSRGGSFRDGAGVE